MIANLMVSLYTGKDPGVLQPNFLRHMVLNTTRAIRMKFKADKWGELILACDDTQYWRKDVFPHYKASRSKKRSESELDWKEIFTHLDAFKNEIKENFPYRVVQVPKCEADDVIATLCAYRGSVGPLNMGEPIKIVSGDEDFKQLQIYGNVSQYDQSRKKDVVSVNPQTEVIQLIISGDSGDGVPNVLSQDNCFVKGIRQKPLRQTKIKELSDTPFEELPSDIQSNWKRNQALVDFDYIPKNYQYDIIKKFDEEGGKGRNKMFSYMVNNQLNLLVQHIGEF